MNLGHVLCFSFAQISVTALNGLQNLTWLALEELKVRRTRGYGLLA